jgi:c(7)-type cytochrome triheme protein
MRRVGVLFAAVLLLACATSSVALAQGMAKLPADITLKQSGDSPGKVTFSHQSHVGFQAKADCTVCHPKLAPIVKTKAQAKRAPITHAKMLKGEACGTCHGKDAHGFDDCTTCHK